MAELASVRVTVHGRVTGIGFRAFTAHHAITLGLNGYARNLPDDSVEIEAEGERGKLDKFISLLKKGPPLSRVQKADITWSDFKAVYQEFSIRR